MSPTSLSLFLVTTGPYLHLPVIHKKSPHPKKYEGNQYESLKGLRSMRLEETWSAKRKKPKVIQMDTGKVNKIP